jgi:hypothetical protein
MQNPLADGQGETVPVVVPVRELGQNAPRGLPRRLMGETDDRRAAPRSWLRRWCCGTVAGFQPEC